MEIIIAVYFVVMVLVMLEIRKDAKKRGRGVKKWYFFTLLCPPLSAIAYCMTNEIEDGEQRFPIKIAALIFISIPLFVGVQVISDIRDKEKAEKEAPILCIVKADSVVSLDANGLDISDFKGDLETGHKKDAMQMIIEEKIYVPQEDVLIMAKGMKAPPKENVYVFGVLASGEFEGRFVAVEKNDLEK